MHHNIPAISDTVSYSGAPQVRKSVHPKKFVNHVAVHRPTA